MKFRIHTLETAPEASRSLMEEIENAYGFFPNIYAVFAESPVAISAYHHISKQLGEHGALTPQEQQIVMLAISLDNECDYCAAAHRKVAEMTQVPGETIETLSRGELPSDPKQATLVQFTLEVNRERGWPSDEIMNAFEAAGYTSRHALDVVTILAMKTLSNYTNHLAGTPIDSEFG